MGVLIYRVAILTDGNMIVDFFLGCSKRRLASIGELPLCMVVTCGIPVFWQAVFNSLLRSGLRRGRRRGGYSSGGRGLWRAPGALLGLAGAGRSGASQPAVSGGLRATLPTAEAGGGLAVPKSK